LILSEEPLVTVAVPSFNQGRYLADALVPILGQGLRVETVVAGGDTGLVVPPSDPAAFHEAMRFLWDNPNAAAEMGKRAEQRYWDIFTAEDMVASYVDLYRALLGAHASRPVPAGKAA
jgi:hypothetical protein